MKAPKTAKVNPAPITPAPTVNAKTAANAARLTHVITVLKPNPKKAGSKSFERYNAYKTGMTVAEAQKAGVRAGDIIWDAKRAFIALN